MVRKSLFAGLIAGICVIAAHGFAEDKLKEEKEKSELAKIMGEIDKNYKAAERISGYYKYNDNDWSDLAEASANIIQLTKVVISKFSRPDDKKYQDLNKSMLTESEKMLEVTKHRNEKGALEDAQWQVRRLRQTCAVCHKHLGIHLYPQLYPGKKDELQPGQEEIPAPKETGVPKDW
ncbi:MAG: hypothetical protein OZ917_06520 [Candidatus Brocadiaceae bacterium]|nr:hypothetical protein [Candidatus Brocadiaceae bacterium]